MAKNLFKTKTLAEEPVVISDPAIKYRDEKVIIKNAWLKDKATWVPLTLNEIKSLTMKEVIEELTILLLHFQMGGRDYYVVNSDASYEAVKKKYPKSCVIHITQLIRLWTHYIDADYLNGVGPKVLMAIEEFSASVENVVDIPPELQ